MVIMSPAESKPGLRFIHPFGALLHERATPAFTRRGHQPARRAPAGVCGTVRAALQKVKNGKLVGKDMNTETASTLEIKGNE